MSMIMVLKQASPQGGAAIPFSASKRLRAGGGDAASISLEKAWHGLHFLLSGDPWGGDGPEAFLLCGGTEAGEDLGYGPPRRFDADEVQEIAELLDGLSGDDLWGGFNPEAMAEAEIYGANWDDEDEEDLREEFLEYYEILKAFVLRTAKAGQSFEIEMT